MTKRYTATDFANARFAEKGNRRAARRSTGGGRVWIESGAEWSDADMAANGWVPVPTKPTITASGYRLSVDDRHPQYVYGFIDAMNKFGIEVVPDPEPTNTDRLETLIRESGFEVFTLGHIVNTRELAEWLNNDGVTAPKEDK